jgi:hypothetical protein
MKKTIQVPESQMANGKGAKAQPLTLERMDAMPMASARQHRLMSDMSGDELSQMVRCLDAARAQHDGFSGVCATLAGLVCIEAKKQLKHGQYLPWLKSSLGKSRVTASEYVSVASAFLKCKTRLTFDQMTLALMDGSSEVATQALDMTHPVVSAVAKWANGRSFRKLIEEEAVDGRAKNKGGNQHPKCPHCGGNLKTKKQQICPHCKKDTGAPVEEGDPKQAEAIDLWTPLLRDLRLEAIEHKSFVHLPDKGPVSRETLKALVTDLRQALRAVERSAE